MKSNNLTLLYGFEASVCVCVCAWNGVSKTNKENDTVREIILIAMKGTGENFGLLSNFEHILDQH